MKKKNWIVLSLLSSIIITAFVLSPILYNRFVWDDFEYIVRNNNLSKPFSDGINYFFHQNYFVGNYHPLTMLGFLLEYHHAKLNPAFYHQVNLIIHLFNVALVFWFVYLLSNKKIVVAALVSLLFGIHPMHVESVAWISELKDLLYSLFYLFGLIVYVNYLNGPARIKSILYISCLLFFILALLSKPAAVSFPLTLMVIDYYFHRKLSFPLLFEKVPFIIGSIILGLITIKAQGSAVSSLEQFDFVERIMLSSFSLIQYVIKLIAPINLSAFHPYPPRINGQFPWLFRIAPLMLITLIYILYKSFRTKRLLVFGILFFIVNIIFVLQFIAVGMTVTSERYTYLPYLGLFFLVSMHLSEYIEQESMSNLKLNLTICSSICILFILGITSFNRSKIWKSDKTMWGDVLKKYPQCAIAHYNLGTYYFKEEINNAQALINYNQSLKYDSTYLKAYVNLGIIYTRMKEYSKAEINFSRAMALDSNFSETYKNLGMLHNYMGNHEKAIEDYSHYLALESKNAEIYYGRGMTFYQLKRFEEAVKDLNYAIEFDSKNSNYWIMKSMALNASGKKEEAVEAALKAQYLGEILDPAYKQSLEIK